MPQPARSGALPTIFSFFLGLIMTAFVGVGVYTFYPSPARNFDRQVEDLDRRDREVRNSRSPEQLSQADRDRIRVLDDERSEVRDAMRDAREAWGRITSIILIVFATIVMATALVRADRLPVISNGLLLGGVFTMLYGVGWIVATDTSVTRFVVISVALVITLVLGYVRFVRRETAAPAPAASGAGDMDLGQLGQRVRDLEERLDRAASVLAERDR